METHHLKLVETTIQFLQFMTSIFIILLTATGAVFYYYWTNKTRNMKIRDLWPFVIPAASVIGVFIFMARTYSILINGLAGGTITQYMEFWFKWVGLVLWLGLAISIGGALFAFIIVHKKGHNT